MKSATRISIAILVMLLWAVPSQAQTSEVTFQVDMSTAIDSCQFLPEEETVYVRGSFQASDDNPDGFTLENPMADDDGDGLYTATVEIEPGTITYKFYVGKTDESGDGILGWEDGSDREYTVTEDAEQTIEVAEFNKPIEDICNVETESYELEFRVDMSVASITDKFNPGDDVVTLAGSINGWNTTADTLEQDFVDPDIYFTIVELEDATVPQTLAYKFVIGKPDTDAPSGWESIDDRTFDLTGDEADEDGNGLLDVVIGPNFFDNVGPDEVFTEDTQVTFEVDLRPAYYYLEDNGQLPADTQTGEPVEDLTGVWINGPVAGAADGLDDWSDWGAEGLAALDSRKMFDDGTNGDATAGDSIFTTQYDYSAGTPRALVGKFGASGFDTEGGFGVNQNFTIDPDNPMVSAVFGAVRQPDGDFTDDCGPLSEAAPDDCTGGGQYDPYILIDNEAGTVEVVRSGGDADGTNTAVEPVDGEVPTSIALGQNYPNPFNPSTTFEYRLDRSQHVTVRVYDLLGRVVDTLVDGVQPASTYRVTFDGSDLASGVYIYQMQAGDQVISKTMTLLK